MAAALTWTVLLNYGLFQVGWCICVLGAAAWQPWPATMAGLMLVLAHLALVRDVARESLLLLTGLLLGLLIDGFHIHTGVLIFPIGALHPGLPPPWILVLWLQFAMTLHFSLSWLAGRYGLGALLGSVAGALAYWAGVRFGAADFGADPARCLIQIGLSWGLTLLVLLKVSQLTAPTEKGRTYRLFPDR